MRSSAHRACDDFHRTSEAVRRGYLGDGLTRRQVLLRGLGAGLAVYTAKALPLGRMLDAVEAAAAAPPGRVLVAVFLPGGCDLLDTLPPVAQLGPYMDLRRNTAPKSMPALGSTGLAHHPSLAEGAGGGIAGLFAAGKVGFLPGIDYANPDLSHFHSRHFWETGLVTTRDAPGWLGRWLDRHGSADNPLQGVSADYDLSPVLRSARAPVAAVASPGAAQFWWRGVWGETEELVERAWGRISRTHARHEALAASRRTARLAQRVAEVLAPYQPKDDGTDPLAPKVPYPEGSDFGESLAHLAALIQLPLGVRVATVSAPGDFDTHDNQPGELGKTLKEVSACLAAFQADLEERGVADRVLTFVWSEFGRRAEANESAGTDHGAGGIAWVQGTHARPGVLTEYPDLRRLDDEGNLAITVDFRRVYASLLEEWLGTDAGEVIPRAGAFGRVGLVR